MSDNNRKVELERCPFCGGEAKGQSYNGDHWINCECQEMQPTKEEAIEAWNTRTKPSPIENNTNINLLENFVDKCITDKCLNLEDAEEVLGQIEGRVADVSKTSDKAISEALGEVGKELNILETLSDLKRVSYPRKVLVGKLTKIQNILEQNNKGVNVE